jgi:Carboxypeptidase regulatory-like domain
MLRISKWIGWAAVLALSATALVSCGGGGGSSTPVASTTFVSGKVQSSAGAPLAGAVVSGQGQSVTTGADGAYRLDASAAGANVVVLVKKTGYATTAKEVPLVSGKTTQIDMALFADQVTTSFSATTAANITVSSANLKILANAITSSNGQNYTGTVNVAASYYSPDTTQGVQAFAGPYTGLDGSVQSPIISMGFMEVKLTDAQGNPLQLKAGSPATLTFAPSSNTGSATSVPLWFYDEAAKIWKREGTASRQPDGTFQGTVAHFTIWNADFFGLNATLKGCFRNSAGQPVTDVGLITLFGTGWSKYLPSSNSDGNFTINLVPANMPLQLQSAIVPPTFAPIVIPALAPGEVRQLACAVATPVAPGSVLVITTPAGTVTLPAGTTTVPSGTGTTASFAGNYTGTFAGSEVGTFNVNITGAGLITGSNFSQTNNQTVGVSGQVNSNGSVNLTASGAAGSASFTGSINSSFVISGTWAYASPQVGGGTFTGRRN